MLRPPTNFDRWLGEQYRKDPGLMKRVKKHVAEMKQQGDDLIHIFADWIENGMWSEKFRKLLEREIKAHRKMEKSIKRGIEQSHKGKLVPYEEVKRRLGLK